MYLRRGDVDAPHEMRVHVHVRRLPPHLEQLGVQLLAQADLDLPRDGLPLPAEIERDRVPAAPDVAVVWPEFSRVFQRERVLGGIPVREQVPECVFGDGGHGTLLSGIFFSLIIGKSSIAIYMMAHLFDFKLIGNIFVGGLGSLFAPNVQDFIQAVGAMVVMWLIMYWLYLKKTFIKI